MEENSVLILEISFARVITDETHNQPSSSPVSQVETHDWSFKVHLNSRHLSFFQYSNHVLQGLNQAE